MRAWPILLVACLLLAGCQSPDGSSAPKSDDRSGGGEGSGSVSQRIIVAPNASANSSGNRTAP